MVLIMLLEAKMVIEKVSESVDLRCLTSFCINIDIRIDKQIALFS